MSGANYARTPKGNPITEAAKQWEGWGTALKPAMEPITVARKPLIGTVAENVLMHGTGALNIDAARVGTEERENAQKDTTAWHGNNWSAKPQKSNGEVKIATGRWPANFIHDGSDEVVGLFPQSVARPVKPENVGKSGTGNHMASEWTIGGKVTSGYYDTETSAARFFYCAKASKADRDAGCEGLEEQDVHRYGAGIGEGVDPKAPARNRNHHPTVKPTDLMRYLCKLVTPPDGIVLDPFMGSGSTGKAATLEGFSFIGIEREAEYIAIAEARIKAVATMYDTISVASTK
jgi:site-specific DNA-methyltransferase (adenine-specific)